MVGRFDLPYLGIELMVENAFSLCGDSEVDEIYRICAVIGSPNQQTWSDGLKLAGSLNFQFPQVHT